MLKAFKKRGFTLVETLIAVLLLSLVLIGVSHIVSMLADITATSDRTTFSNDDYSYTLQTLSEDIYLSKSFTLADDTLYLRTFSGEKIQYSISNGVLFRNSKPLTDIVSGSFTPENASQCSILLNFPQNQTIRLTIFGGDND